MDCQFVSQYEVARHLNVSATTLKRYRRDGKLIEGIHWMRLSQRCIRYNLDLIRDWLQNRNNWPVHRRAIEVYQASLLSNQPLPKGRQKSA